MLVSTQKIKVLARKSFDIGKGTCSFSSLSYCIIDRDTCIPEPGYYRLQITDCSNTYFLATSNIRDVTKAVKKIIVCIEKAITSSKSVNPRTRRWKLSSSKDILYKVYGKADLAFTIVSRIRPINLGKGGGFYTYPKRTFLHIHARHIITSNTFLGDLDKDNKKHFILRLTRLIAGLNDFLSALSVVK